MTVDTGTTGLFEKWLDVPTAQVIDAATLAIERYAPGHYQKDLLKMVLDCSSSISQAKSGIRTMSIHLPLLVHIGITGDMQPAVNIAAALLLLETGIYALDHIMDKEVGPPLDSLPTSSLLLGACSFLCHLPQRVLLDTSCDDATRLQLQRTLSEGLARIAEGQLADIASKDMSEPHPDEIERAVIGKTGDRRALYAVLAAQLAGGTSEQINSYANYANALGVARQLRSDLNDLFVDRASRDLKCGIRTLPLALYLSRESGERKNIMLDLLERVRHEPILQVDICRLLQESGDFRHTLMRNEAYCQRALSFLEEADPCEPAKQELVNAVNVLSLATQ